MSCRSTLRAISHRGLDRCALHARLLAARKVYEVGLARQQKLCSQLRPSSADQSRRLPSARFLYPYAKIPVNMEICGLSVAFDEPWSEQWHAASTLAGLWSTGNPFLKTSEYSPRQIASRSTHAQIKQVVDCADYALALVYSC